MRSREQLLRENEELRIRLDEAEQTLQAIRNGEVDAIVVSGKQGEQVFSLSGAEQVYRLIVETMHEAALTVSLDGRVLFCNRQFAELLRIPAKKIVGRPLANLIPSAEREEAETILSRSRREHVAGRLVFRRDDSREVPVHISATLLRTPEGESVCLVATDLSELESSTMLIRELKRQREALRESQNRLQRVLQIETVGVLFFDLEGTFLDANDAFLRMIGYDRGALERGELRSDRVTLPEWMPRTRRAFDELKESGRCNPYEKELVRPDGSRWWGLFAGTSLGENEAVEFVLDITGTKQMEKHLRETKEQAESATRAKSEFLAHMSHEIRTPIGGIIGMVDVLSSRIRDAEQQSQIALVKESAESLLGIINDILDLSRIEAGQVIVDPVECEIRAVVGSTVALFGTAAERKNLDIFLDISDGVPPLVRCDKEKIAQILRNLISNAVKYTDRGSIRISVDSGAATGEQRVRLRFRVTDTGVGIPNDKLTDIFDSFVRLRSSVNERNVEGTGLGLTITKRLVDLLGGTLQVESAYQQGSTFTFSVDVEVLETRRVERAVLSTSGIEALPSLRILLAEDNRINQMFVSMMLTEAGHEVTVAENGKEVLRRLTSSGNRSFDLVLMDVQMPVMDGIETTRRIRGMEGFAAEVPIIALTAFAMNGDEARFRAAGMNGYVTKPIDWGELAREIRELPGLR